MTRPMAFAAVALAASFAASACRPAASDAHPDAGVQVPADAGRAGEGDAGVQDGGGSSTGASTGSTGSGSTGGSGSGSSSGSTTTGSTTATGGTGGTTGTGATSLGGTATGSTGGSGGTTGGSWGSVTGTINGQPASFAGVSYCPSGFTPTDDLTIVFSSRANVCSIDQANQWAANETALTLHLVQVSGPGSFPVKGGSAGPGEALASLTTTDAACNGTGYTDATGGSVEVAAVDSSASGFIRGTFQASFPSGTLSGAFDTSVCRVQYYCTDGSGGCAP